MQGVTNDERAVLEHAAYGPMLEQVQAWAAINSGSRNLDGLAKTARTLADDFGKLPGELRLLDAPDGVLAYERRDGGRVLRVLLNLTAANIAINWEGEVMLSTLGRAPTPGLLRPAEGLLLA